MARQKSLVAETKWAADAETHGWTWLSRTDVKNYSVYKCVFCENEQILHTGAMGKGEVKCAACGDAKMKDKWKAEAAVNGWAWLSKVDNNYGLYRCVECGAEKELTTSSMRKGQVGCVRCGKARLFSKWKDESVAQGDGWVWQKQIDANKSLYFRKDCGHSQVHSMGDMRSGKVRCSQCTEKRWVDESAVHGWEWVNQVDNRQSLYLHTCGHSQNHGMGSMRTGTVACHACGESWATRSSNIYLLKITVPDEIVFLKLGIARNVTARSTNYGLPNRATVDIVMTVAFGTGKEAIKHEKMIHKTIVSHPAVNRFDSSHWMENGFTECYVYSKEAENALSHAMFAASLPDWLQ